MGYGTSLATLFDSVFWGGLTGSSHQRGEFSLGRYKQTTRPGHCLANPSKFYCSSTMCFTLFHSDTSFNRLLVDRPTWKNGLSYYNCKVCSLINDPIGILCSSRTCNYGFSFI